ncbi:MAG TPA: serine hydrolase domain-containing protein [Thermoanaerobaculia bacterium]|jgi:CubicO group peptidase (beta-lactamase class C family)|nr:serine hydrolase domain-containing protein [Thermoanaerobaculia bacterium]
MKTKVLVLAALVAQSLAAAPLPQRVDAYLKPFLGYHAFSGVVLAAKGDRVLLEKAYGMANAEFGVPNTPRTRFAIASITKRFTGIILQRLFDEKKLAPDDLLSKWVPDFPSADQITVTHLMNHRSGLRDPAKLRLIVRRNYSSAQVVELLKTEPIVSKPGDVYSYTTANYAILAHIIERVTGKTYAEAVKQYVYEPAKMSDSGELTTTSVVPRLASAYMPDPFGHGVSVCGPEDTSWKVGGGSSYSTARDLLRFSRAVYDGTLLPKKIAADMFALSDAAGRKALSSSGSFPGASANVLYFPAEEVTVVVLSNNYASVPSTITEAVARMVFGETVATPSVKLAANPNDADPRIAGDYRIPSRGWTFTVSFRDGKPIAAWTDIRMSAMLRMSDDMWFEPLDWATLQLKFDDAGKFVDGAFTIPGFGGPQKVERAP